MSRYLNQQQQMWIDALNMKPAEVKGLYNYTTMHHKRYLYNLIYSVFGFKRFPKDIWNLGYFRYWTFHWGSISTVYTNEYGWIISPYAIETTDIYFYPLKFTANNSHVGKPITAIRGINGEIIHIFDDLFGLESTVNDYAQRLADLDKAFDVNVMNTSFSLIAAVEDKKEATEIKQAYSQATQGSPLVVVSKNLRKEEGLNTLVENPAGNFIAGDIHAARRNVINDFLTEIGVRNANYDKKERLNSQEVEENNDQTSAQAQIILDNLNDCFERVRDVTNGKIDIEAVLNYNYEIIGGGGRNDGDDSSGVL